MSSWAEIHMAARLLRVPPEHLEGAVTRRVTVSLRVLGRHKPNLATRRLAGCPVSVGCDLPRAHLCLPGDTLWPGLEIPACGRRH